jgi:hypothetical protein
VCCADCITVQSCLDQYRWTVCETQVINAGSFYTNERMSVGSEAVTEMVTKSSIFWDVTPCNLVHLLRSSATKYTRLHGVTSPVPLISVPLVLLYFARQSMGSARECV